MARGGWRIPLLNMTPGRFIWTAVIVLVVIAIAVRVPAIRKLVGF